MQFTADILRLELMVAEIPESSARGAAMAAMLGQGMVDFVCGIVVAAANGPATLRAKNGRRDGRAALFRMADRGEASVLRWRTSESSPNILSRRRWRSSRPPNRWPASNRRARSRACRAKRTQLRERFAARVESIEALEPGASPSLPGRRQAASGRRQVSARASANQFSVGKHRAESADDHLDRRRQPVRASAAFRLATVGPGISRIAGGVFSRAAVWCCWHAPPYRRLTIGRSSARSSSRVSA